MMDYTHNKMTYSSSLQDAPLLSQSVAVAVTAGCDYTLTCRSCYTLHTPVAPHHTTGMLLVLLLTYLCHFTVCLRGGYRVLELTAGLKVISIACTPDLRDWGTLLGPLGNLMSLWLAG